MTVGVRDSASGALTYVLGDQLGSTSVAVNASTGAVATQRFLPYGAPRSGSIGATDRGWIGQTKDGSTGLQYLNARYYDPTIGRFTATDPFADLGQPATLDPYGYAGGSPVTLSDPSGLLMTVGSGGRGDYTYGAVYTRDGRIVGGNPSGAPPAAVQEIIEQLYSSPKDSDPRVQAAVDAGALKLPVAQDTFGMLFRALVFDERECTSWGWGCGWQIAGLPPLGKGKKADDALDAFRLLSKGDEAVDAARVIARNLDDPSTLRGATGEEIEALVRGWTKSPTSGPGGVRYAHPERRGDAVRVMPGNPRDPNPLKQGPYVRVSRNRTVSDPIPLAGNPQAG